MNDNVEFFRCFFHELSTNIVFKEKIDEIIRKGNYKNKPFVAVTPSTTKYDFINFYYKDPDDCCVILYEKIEEYTVIGILKDTHGMKDQDLFKDREYYNINSQDS